MIVVSDDYAWKTLARIAHSVDDSVSVLALKVGFVQGASLLRLRKRLPSQQGRHLPYACSELAAAWSRSSSAC